jgi:hypothetical protein
MATFNYTSRDFATIKDDLVTRAAVAIPEWTDRTSSDFMMALIDLWAYSADVLHFYIDRAATEAFLRTATQRDSVLAIANLYDYTPNFRSSAVANVSFTNNGATQVTIPAGTQLYALDNAERTYFYTGVEATLLSGQTLDILCYQGIQLFDQTVSLPSGSDVSDGSSNQRFSIRDVNVTPSSIQVNVYEGVGGVPVTWTYNQNLSSAGASDSNFNVYVAADGYTQIVFGNGINGRIPPTNAVIKASYTVSDGALGNVGPGTITNMSSPIANITINGNANAAFGGADAESITSIKNSLPAVFRTQGRAVSLSDYEDIALSIQGISKAKAVYNGSGTNGGSVTVNVVTYQSDYLTAGSVNSVITVDPMFRAAVASEMSFVSMLGVSTMSLPASVSTERVRITANVAVLPNYTQQRVAEQVEDALAALFDFDVVTFGGRLSLGEVYRTILAVPGVDYATIVHFNKNGSTSLETAVTADTTKLLQRGVFTISPSGGVTPPNV